FLERVIDRGFEVSLRAIVVNAKAAADVEQANAAANACQLDIDPRRLGQGVLDAANVRNLAAEMEMHELQAVGQVPLLQVLERFQTVRLGQHGQQFRLGAGFQPKIEGPAEIQNLLDHVPLLVHLDWVNAAVFALKTELADGVLKGLVDFAHAVAEDVGEAEQD